MMSNFTNKNSNNITCQFIKLKEAIIRSSMSLQPTSTMRLINNRNMTMKILLWMIGAGGICCEEILPLAKE